MGSGPWLGGRGNPHSSSAAAPDLPFRELMGCCFVASALARVSLVCEHLPDWGVGRDELTVERLVSQRDQESMVLPGSVKKTSSGFRGICCAGGLQGWGLFPLPSSDVMLGRSVSSGLFRSLQTWRSAALKKTLHNAGVSLPRGGDPARFPAWGRQSKGGGLSWVPGAREK